MTDTVIRKRILLPLILLGFVAGYIAVGYAVAHADTGAIPAGPDSALDEGRRNGGVWVVAMLLIRKLLHVVAVRLQPLPGDDPNSARSKSLAAYSAAVTGLIAIVDAAAGIGGFWSLVITSLGAAALLWSAFNPRRGERRA